MKLPNHKTKIVCTIGPTSDSQKVLTRLIRNGMNVARINCSHGTIEEHRATIRRIRSVAKELRQPVATMIDLPGPKIRVGILRKQPIILKKGAEITLTTRAVQGTESVIPVNFPPLPRSVSPGSAIFLNDGFIQLKVLDVDGADVHCRVIVGGPLLSHKGLNLPGSNVQLDPVTAHDLKWIEFGLEENIHIYAASFIEKADDILKLKHFAKTKGQSIYTVAKIERMEAIKNIDEILQVADAIMVARGDLGVQIPIEQVPNVQKELIRKANQAGRPVITATQMLESMTQNIRPTRAEVTDVANAILDGTDAVMLSEETAIGRYPADAVSMMSRIARSTESRLPAPNPQQTIENGKTARHTIEDVISYAVIGALQRLNILYILTPTQTGNTSRRISTLKPFNWILSFTQDASVSEFLMLSYGVYPFVVKRNIKDWPAFVVNFLRDNGLAKANRNVILTQGRARSGGTDSLQILILS